MPRRRWGQVTPSPHPSLQKLLTLEHGLQPRLVEVSALGGETELERLRSIRSYTPAPEPPCSRRPSAWMCGQTCQQSSFCCLQTHPRPSRPCGGKARKRLLSLRHSLACEHQLYCYELLPRFSYLKLF